MDERVYTMGETQTRFTPDSGTYARCVCGVCSKDCVTPKEGAEGPRGMVEAWASHSKPGRKFDPYDEWVCPDVRAPWHFQVVLLREERRKTSSGVLRRTLDHEVANILSSRAPTIPDHEITRKVDYQYLPGTPGTERVHP